MAIQLRTNKASALTYNEMDRNFSSFFYSASVDTDTNRLYLWYTGSANLNMSQDDNYGPARSIEVELQPTTGNNPTLVVAGNPRSIQFRHATDPRLDADAGFIYNTAQQLGIGAATPNVTAKIHAVGTSNVPATLRLESLNTGTFNRRAVVDFYQGATSMGSIGRDTHNDNNLYIKTYTPSIRSSGPRGLGLGFEEIINEDPGHVRFTIGNGDRRIGGNFGAFTQVGFGIGTLLPQHALQVQGNGYITGKLGVGDVPNTAALNVFQTAQTGTSLGDFETIAKFGITPQENVDSLKILSVRQLAGGNNWWSNGMRIQQDVDGTYRTYIQFSGEGNMHGFSIGTGESSSPHTPGHPGIQERLRINSTGDVTINKTVANAKLDVNGDTIISGSFTVKGNTVTTGNATIQTIAAGSAATTSALVATSAGLVQKIDAAPIPKGGIILWSGAILDKPAGWHLCDGTNGTPDLRDRFVVGAGSTYAVGNTGGSKDAVVVSHTHTGTTNPSTTGLSGALPRNFGLGTSFEEGRGSPDWAFTDVTGITHTHGFTTNNATNGESGTNKNLPPYYALAYIMYGGI